MNGQALRQNRQIQARPAVRIYLLCCPSDRNRKPLQAPLSGFLVERNESIVRPVCRVGVDRPSRSAFRRVRRFLIDDYRTCICKTFFVR